MTYTWNSVQAWAEGELWPLVDQLVLALLVALVTVTLDTAGIHTTAVVAVIGAAGRASSSWSRARSWPTPASTPSRARPLALGTGS